MHNDDMVDQHVRIINVQCTCCLNLGFYFVESSKDERLCEFSRFSKCENDVITARGVIFLGQIPKFVCTGSSINSKHTNKYNTQKKSHINCSAFKTVVRACSNI